jgi:alpha/beta superfamily hydrolase
LIARAKKINAPMEIISGADHFYMGKEKELMCILQKYIIDIKGKM